MDSSQQRHATTPLQAEYDRLWASHPRIYERLEELEDRLGHRFAQRPLLYEALTHRSALMELSAQPEALALPWNERLEFLGDSVLGLAISRRLMVRGAELAEGELSRIRAALVNEEYLAEIARGLELGRFIVMGKGAAQSGGRNRDSLLADALEALIGAVFVDGGFDAADALIGRLFEATLTGDVRALVQLDFKTMLQELTQDALKATPIYETVTTVGPDHAKEFEVRVLVNGRECGRGHGGSKKRASQEAARQALDQLTKRGFSLP